MASSEAWYSYYNPGAAATSTWAIEQDSCYESRDEYGQVCSEVTWTDTCVSIILTLEIM